MSYKIRPVIQEYPEQLQAMVGIQTEQTTPLNLSSAKYTIMNNTHQKILEACQECLIDCQNCLHQMAGKESMNDCPNCCIECVDACYVTIKAIANNSKWTEKYVKICMEICEWCADQCGAHDHDHCQRCAASCRKCISACKELLAAA